MRFVVVPFVPLLTACATVNYGLAPLPPSDPSPAARCAYDRSLALVPGSGKTEIVDDSGMRVGWSPYGGTSISYVGPAITHTTGASGYSFFLGQERLSLKEGLDKLDDPRIAERYQQDLDRFSSGRYHRWARPAWIALISGGLALVIAGSVTALSVKTDENGNSDYSTPITLLLGSIPALLGSIPFLAFDLLNRDEEAELDVREALLVTDPETKDAVDASVRRYNEKARASCEDAGR